MNLKCSKGICCVQKFVTIYSIILSLTTVFLTDCEKGIDFPTNITIII